MFSLVAPRGPYFFGHLARLLCCDKVSPSLATVLCGISLKTPVLAASGTYAYGVEFKELVDLDALGGIVVKGLSREPMDGNLPPRLFETEAGMLNSVGLQNIGVRAFVRDKLPELRKIDTAVIANVFGYAVEDYVEVATVLEDAEGLAAYELNVSCPNTKHGGIFFSRDPSLLAEVVRAVRGRRRRDLPDQHICRAFDRRPYSASASGCGIRRTLRSGDQAHRVKDGL
jgi:dihydroorotate dehydrogenase (NAD+) catalytic subunit